MATGRRDARKTKAAKSGTGARGKPRKGSHARSRIGRPPGKSSAETRQAILDAARQQFVSVGYERATNRAIAELARVTSAAIYQYFESKTALYLAVVSANMEELMPRLRAATDGVASARAALSALAREQLGVERDAIPLRFLAMIPIEIQRHPELARAFVAEPGAFFDLVMEIVQRGVDNGEIDATRAEHVVAMFLSALIGLSIHASTMPASHAQAGAAGFIELIEGTLFR